jgi:hypothetical protein
MKKEELLTVCKDGKYMSVERKLPSEVNTKDYIIGFAFAPPNLGAVPESVEEYEIRAGVILNATSRRMKNGGAKLMSEINRKLKKLGVKHKPIIMKDMWDDNGLRPERKEHSDDNICPECGQEKSSGVFHGGGY